MRQRKSTLSLSVSAVGLAVAALVAPVQAQNTTAAVGGQVLGADGSPVGAATVSVTHVESGSTVVTTSDANGRWQARGLRVGGPYTITAAKGGQSDKRDNIFLTLAETTALDLAIGSSQVVVTGKTASAVFDTTSMGAGTAITGRELAALPSIQRNLQDYARLDPRFAQTDKSRGEISMAGMNPRYNSITVDGLSINDPFGLEANNLPMLKQPVPMDAIESVQVNVSNYDTTQKAYVGANTNAVTRSGTNELSGSIFYALRNDKLSGQRYNQTTDAFYSPPPFKETSKGFTLGGPIEKDRLFFFVAYEELSSSRTQPDFGPVGGSGTNVGITQDMINGALKVAKDKYNLDLGSLSAGGSTALTVKDVLGKLDWNISDRHRASLRMARTEQNEPIFTNFGATSLGLSSNWYNQGKTLNSTVAQWFADWTDTFSTEVKLSKRGYNSIPTPFTGVRMPQILFSYTGALPDGLPANFSTANRSLYAGTERSRHTNVLKTDNQDSYAAGTWLLGEHEVKAGVDRSDNTVYNAFLQDTLGNYTFRCENGTYSFGTVNCATANAATVSAAMLENFAQGKPSSYQVQQALPGRTLDDAIARWKYSLTGLFIQDAWKVNKTFNVMLGVRLDQLGVPIKPIANAAAAAPMVMGNPTTGAKQSGGFGLDNTQTLDGTTLVQPRVGFNWNLGDGQRLMQLRGGAGLFQGAAANVWLSNPFSNTGVAAGVVSCTSFTVCASQGAKFSADPNSQPSLVGSPPAANVDFLSPGLKQPSTWKMNLALDAELPSLPVIGTTVAGIEAIHTTVNSGLFYQALNLGAPTRTGVDGRQLFWSPQGFDPACYTPGGGANITSGNCTQSFRDRFLRNTAYANVTLAKETKMGGSDSLTLSLQRPLAGGFGWGVGYTRTSSTEVSPLTSSVANSNWNGRVIFNPNEEVASNSNYLIRDRITANMVWQKAFVSDLRTSVGLFYEGRAGKPYSWVFANDMNGDGVGNNDLLYIPKAPGSGEVVFRGGQAEEDKFWQIVNSNPQLAKVRGGVAGRNTSFAAWANSFDLRLNQELPALSKGHKASLTFDILNIGNLINKRWGQIYEANFPSTRSFVYYNGVDAQGRYVYSLANSLQDTPIQQSSGQSQWAAQVTLKYAF